jgi:hypothetical protein
LEHNETDLMTDYFGSRTEATVVIGWSRHDLHLLDVASGTCRV